MLNLRDGGRKTKQRWTVIKSLCFLKSGFLRARIQVRESDIPPAKSSRTITHKFPSSLQCLKCTLYLIPFFRPSYPSLHCSFYTSLLRFCHSSFPCTLRASLISSKLRNTLRCHMQLCPAILHLHSQSRDWTMAQENTSRPLAAEVRVHFGASSFPGQSISVVDKEAMGLVSLRVLLSCHYPSTKASYAFTHLSPTVYNRRN